MSRNGKNQIATMDEVMAGMPADFAFFPDRFDNEIKPGLAEREDCRVKAVKKQRDFAIYGVIATIVIAGGGFALFDNTIPIFIGIAAGLGLWGWGGMELSRIGKETKLMLVEPVAKEFGMTFNVAPPAPGDILHFRQLGLVSKWDRAKFEDLLTGTRSDAPFQFFEAHLEEKRTTRDSKGRTRTTWVTVFKGQCLVVKFHKQFEGVTKVFRDAGVLNALIRMGQGMPNIKLEDPVFEKAFEVYGTDQIEARYILTPDFMERLLKLEQTFSGKKLRCGFSGGEMLLCVEGKNLFEPGSMYRPMADLNRVREILEDFAAVFLLIDSMAQRLTPEALRARPVQ